MTSLVSPSFFRQKARQLKKEKSISLHQAYDEVAIQYRFSNYKNYLNALKANHKASPTRENLFKSILSEKDIIKKESLAVSFLHSFNPPSFQLFEIINQFHAE